MENCHFKVCTTTEMCYNILSSPSNRENYKPRKAKTQKPRKIGAREKNPLYSTLLSNKNMILCILLFLPGQKLFWIGMKKKEQSCDSKNI